MKRSRSFAVVAAVAAVAMLSANIALADDISNNLDASIDATAEVMPLNVGGANGTTQLFVTARNGDGKNGCNLTGSTTLTLSISSSNAAAATVSPASVTFSSCSDTQALTITPVAQGSATISASQTSNNTGGTFNLAPITFTVNVAPPANTAPTISVAGVTGGTSYDKGSVPAATCQASDVEDGSSSPAATLSAITGTYASDGIGSQTASCSYTDRGGLLASASASYSIVDPSGPAISPTVTGTLGDNGWYVGDVSVTWSVTDAESTVSSTGCEAVSITADQVATTYTCSATSAGGSDSESVIIKRDATAPVVNPADVTNSTWRNVDLSQDFTASDALSGLAVPADATFTLTASTESASSSAPTTDTKMVKDQAGNSTARTLSALIDLMAPTVTRGGATAAPNGSNGWYTTAVTVTFTATDGLSGLAGASSFNQSSGTDEGLAITIPSGGVADTAGNSNSGIDSDPFKIDLSDPTNVQFVGGPAAGSSAYPAALPGAPTCTASDDVSGFASCVVTGHGTAIGTHTMTATATDNAGRTATATREYTVLAPWTFTGNGFFSPIDMGGVQNTVRGGSTVPVKFALFDGSTRITDVTGITVRMSAPYACGATAQDAIETMVSGGSTTLRYDSTAQQFIMNWKTPTSATNRCITVTATAPGAGNTAITAVFRMK